MNISAKIKEYDAWPEISYSELKPTLYLLHRMIQMLGKVKLSSPFEPHWSNVILLPTSGGITTGAIPYKSGVFDAFFDTVEHKIVFNSSWGKKSAFELSPLSVAETYTKFLNCLKEIEVEISINPMPQEVADAISFEKDSESRPYDRALVNAWWRILISSYGVLEKYHARFNGISPSVGLMWGTLDLRDARIKNCPVFPLKKNIIERNAYDVHQFEAGFWAGDEEYPKPAYFSFMHPLPPNIEQAKIKPEFAGWNNEMGEFIVDYEDIRKAQNPEEALLAFFESSYEVSADASGWNPKLIGSGKPI